MKRQILVCQNDSQHAQWLKLHLEVLAADAEVKCFGSAELERELAECRMEHAADEALLLFAVDVSAAGTGDDALPALEELCRRADRPPVVAIATHGNEASAVRAIRAGAADYVARDALAAGRVVRLLPGWDVDTNYQGMAYLLFAAARYTTPKMRAMIDHLVATLPHGKEVAIPS